MRRILPLSLSPLVCAACIGAQAHSAEALPAATDWRAARIHHAETGVWYANVDKVVDAFGQPEVVCADDQGNFKVLTVYSGQWYTNAVVCDGLWLAPSRAADVDPRVSGRELYAAGRAGSVHQVTLRPQPFARFTLESREIGHAAGQEFHAIVAADLVPGGGDELLVFGITGAVFQLTADATGAAFAMRQVAELPGRVRDVVVLPAPASHGAASLLGVSRSGHLLRMRLTASGLTHETVLREDCGLGRVALGRDPGVAYATRDDGVLLRLVVAANGVVERRPIYAGGQGLRGVSAGRFFADGREAVAVYGYDRRVHLVARGADGAFAVETIFEGQQKGHWLAVGELDGRNGTDELVATGFDGDVVLLARQAGYALDGAAVPVEERAPPGAPPAAPAGGERALRVAARFGERAWTELSPLHYQGGFESKALVYETLVRLDRHGRPAPGLAAAWRREQDGRVFVFTLRDGATWHDGAPVTASDVAVHFKRWVGLPEHDWLPSNARIVAVRADGLRDVRVELDRPCALLADLCAINPTAVVAPGARTREGDFRAPVGSGPFAFAGMREDGRVLRYRRHGGVGLLDLVRCDGDALDLLLRGDVDAVVGSWLVDVDPARAATLRRAARFSVVDGPGSSMWHLALAWHAGPLADLGRRRAVAAAIDRDELVQVVMRGFADASTGYAAPSLSDWPQGKVAAAAAAAFAAPLRLATLGADPRLVEAVAAQLRRAAIPIVLVDGGGEADLSLQRTHGVPYDPFTVVHRFGVPSPHATAAARQSGKHDPELAGAVAALAAEADETQWPQHYARIQARLDELVPLVPLFAPRRVAVVRRGLDPGVLDHDLYRLPEGLFAAAR